MREIGHAQNSVHGRPDFWLMLGQKIALCAVRRLRVFFRLMQGLFGPLALGHVRKVTTDPRNSPSFITG